MSFTESAQIAVVVGIAVAVGPARATGLTDTLYDMAVGKICDSFVGKSVLEQYKGLDRYLDSYQPLSEKERNNLKKFVKWQKAII